VHTGSERLIKPITVAKKRPRLAPPALDPLALALVDRIGPLYAKLALGISSISFLRGERFVRAAAEFYEGRARLILAFRHPYGDEPQILSLAMHRGLVREARALGLAPPRKPHCLFLHGYEVPLWSGPLVRWILPRTGAMPVYHVRRDGAGLRNIRRALREGAHPLALAPEGQSSYRSETLPRIEHGGFQLGFWCAEELEAAGRPEKVHILPISVHERHGDGDLPALEARCAELEKSLGLPTAKLPGRAAEPTTASAASPPPSAANPANERRRALGLRLRDLDLALLATAEAYYGLKPTDGASRDVRHSSLLEEALRRAEAMLGMEAEGDTINRVYRIRHEGWNRVFPEDDPGGLSPRARAVADRRAGEAWYAMRHMELVDLGYYLDAAYLEEGLAEGRAPSVGRLSETLHNLYDFSARLAGGNISDRPRLLRRRLVLAVGEPLELRSRLGAYRADRRAALDEASRDLASEWIRSTKEFTDGNS